MESENKGPPSFLRMAVISGIYDPPLHTITSIVKATENNSKGLPALTRRRFKQPIYILKQYERGLLFQKDFINLPPKNPFLPFNPFFAISRMSNRIVLAGEATSKQRMIWYFVFIDKANIYI